MYSIYSYINEIIDKYTEYTDFDGCLMYLYDKSYKHNKYVIIFDFNYMLISC